MLENFSLVELVLFAVIWLILGALPGFYLFYAINRSPRQGAMVGAGVGFLVGFGIALSGQITDIQGLATSTFIMWGAFAIIGVASNITKLGTGTHYQHVGIQQSAADLAYGLLLPTVVIVSMIVVFPMIWNVVLAFRPVRLGDLPTIRIFALDGLTLNNFERVFRGSETFFETFWPAALDTLIVVVLLAAGWFIGRFLFDRLHRDRSTGSWIGLVIALIIALIYVSQREYTESFNTLLTGNRFLNTLLRTFVYTFAGTILAIGMGLIGALVVKDSFRGRNIVRGFMLFPYIAPVVSVVFVWKLLLNAQFGLVNEFVAASGGQRTDFLTTPATAFLMIVLFQGWRYFPFAFLFILARIQAIPDDIYEAGKVDGAAPSQRLIYITLPQLRAVFGTLFVLRFIWTFNKFDDVFLLTGGAASTQLVTIEIYDQLFGRSNIGISSAVALVLAAVLIVVVGIYFKWFMVEEN